MDINEAIAFSEDLMLHLTRKMNIAWIPQSSTLESGRTSSSPFQERIGDVVFHRLKFHWRFPEEFACTMAKIEDVDKYLFDKYFPFLFANNLSFNFLDYCGQLICVGLLFYFKGYCPSLDFCLSAIATNMAYFINNGEISYNDFWYQLQVIAENIKFVTKYRPSEPKTVYDWYAYHRCINV